MIFKADKIFGVPVNSKSFKGKVTFKKLLDSSLARKLGWTHKTNFEKGISIVINDYLKNHLKKS